MSERQSTHDGELDTRNDNILIYVNGELVPREQATVSVYDSGFMLLMALGRDCVSTTASGRFSMSILTGYMRRRNISTLMSVYQGAIWLPPWR